MVLSLKKKKYIKKKNPLNTSTQLLLLAYTAGATCSYRPKKFKSTHQFTNGQLPQAQGVFVDIEAQVKDMHLSRLLGIAKGVCL